MLAQRNIATDYSFWAQRISVWELPVAFGVSSHSRTHITQMLFILFIFHCGMIIPSNEAYTKWLFFFFLNPVFQENTLFVFVLGKECQNPGKTILRYFCQRSQPDQSQLCLQLISFPTQNAQGLLWSWISSSLLSIPSFPMTFQSDTDAVLSAPLI